MNYEFKIRFDEPEENEMTVAASFKAIREEEISPQAKLVKMCRVMKMENPDMTEAQVQELVFSAEPELHQAHLDSNGTY